MGCDGGTIPRRDELVRLKKKPEKKDKDSEIATKWKTCALTQQELQRPIVACELGRLYNKDSIIELLLDRAKFEGALNCDHIRGLKDVKEIQLTENPDFKGTKDKKGDTTVDRQPAEYICPVTGIEMRGIYKFVFLYGCGCVFSDRAMKEVKTETCHKMQILYMDSMPDPNDYIGITTSAMPEFYYPIGTSQTQDDGEEDVVCDEGHDRTTLTVKLPKTYDAPALKDILNRQQYPNIDCRTVNKTSEECGASLTEVEIVECGKTFRVEDQVVINGTEEDVDLMKTNMEQRRLQAKLEKKAKKKKAEAAAGVASSSTDGPSEAKKSKTVKFTEASAASGGGKFKIGSRLASGAPSTSGAANGSTTAGGTSDKKPQSVQNDPSASAAYKSLFTTCEKAKKQQKAHWVTYNPCFY